MEKIKVLDDRPLSRDIQAILFRHRHFKGNITLVLEELNDGELEEILGNIDNLDPVNILEYILVSEYESIALEVKDYEEVNTVELIKLKSWLFRTLVKFMLLVGGIGVAYAVFRDFTDIESLMEGGLNVLSVLME